MQDSIGSYLSCMEEIKSRAQIVSDVIENKLSAGREDYDWELVALELRKILELIAFSTIAGNFDAYTATYKNAHKHWNAERILRDVEAINPDFYPIPGKISGPDEKGVRKVATSDDTDFLSRDEFIQLYRLCGSALHIPNLIKGKSAINFIYHPSVWLSKIFQLLSTHYIQLLNEGKIWLIVMKHPKDGKAHGYPMEPASNIDAKQ